MACVATGGVNRVADQVRVLAIASNKRSPIYPYAPTMKELGIDLVAGSTRTLVAPKGLPAEVLNKLRAAFDKIVADPAFIKKMKGVKKIVDGTNGVETEERIVKAEKSLKAVWDKSPWIAR
jgi:tripartite-type tricarboxylate transporter receptor subunit TctC